MRSRWNLLIVIGYALTSLVLLSALVFQLGLTPPWEHPYVVTATFSDANGILSGNDVDMNGVRIGRVTSVTVHNGQARVVMELTGASGTPLSTQSTAEVRTKNLLGETYIDLQRGSTSCSGCAMASGGSIPVSRTVPLTEIDQVLAVFDPTTVERVQLLLDAIGEGTAGQGGALNSEAQTSQQLITSLETPATELSVRRAQLNEIVQELQAFYALLAAQRQQIVGALTTWNQVMGQLAAQEASIGSTITQADQLVTDLNALLAGESGNVRATLADLPQTLRETNAFLRQSGSLLGTLTPYRGDIHAVFPNLASSFADTDAQGQHFWSVYSVSCTTGCNPGAPPANTAGAPGSAATPGASVFSEESGQ